MSHEVAEDTFRKVLPGWVYRRVVDILRWQYDGENGYNPGSQLVQIAGISVLNPLDHYIKEQLHVKLYLRYMDDFILIHNDKEYLESCKQKIIEYLAGLKFEIHEKKTRIFPLSEGARFLGFDFRLTNTGKVLMLIAPENVKAERRKLRRLVAKSKRGGLPRDKVDESYAAWKNHASKGNSYHLLQRMDAYYYELWRNVI